MPIRSLADLRLEPIPPWFWRGFLLPRHMTLLAAFPKVGKSTLAFYIVRSIMLSQPFWGLETMQIPLLYISEEAPSLLSRRATKLDFDDSWPVWFMPAEPGRRWEDTLRYVQRFSRQHPTGAIVILDTISRHWSVADENQAPQIEIALNPLLNLVRGNELAFLAVHHTRKTGGPQGASIRGSGALLGNFDIAAELTRVTPWDRSARRKLETYSRYEETPESLMLELTPDGYVVVDEEGGSTLEQDVLRLLSQQDGATAETLAEAVGVGLRYTREVLAQLASRGVVERQGTGSRGSPFRYSLKAWELK